MNKQLEAEGVKLSLNDFVSKAVAAALLRHPAVNAHSPATRSSASATFTWASPSRSRRPDRPRHPQRRQMGLRELQQRTAELAKSHAPPRRG